MYFRLMNDNLSNKNSKPLRRVRSFVKRVGRMTQFQKKAIENYWNKFGINFTESYLNFNQLFGNDNPVILEIGFGMGDSLVQMAKKHPDTNYIGIEVHTPGVGNILANINQLELKNIRIVEYDAIDVLQKMIFNNTLSGVQIFFPDPWHKTRHHKRRLIQREFLELVSTKIMKAGFIHVATDWAHYAEQIILLLEESSYFNNKFEGYAPRPDSRPLTKFEKRGERLKHGVWDIYFQRI